MVSGTVQAARRHLSGILPVERLGAEQKGEMLALLQAYFRGVARPDFERDLAEKEWVLQLRDDSGRLLGFSTLMRLETEGALVFYSGDTIVTESGRQSGELSRAWSKHVFKLAAEVAPRLCYWFLLSSGYRTYRFLPVFFREFYPDYRVSTPEREQRLLDGLAQARFGDLYQAGVVRLQSGLRDSRIPPNRLADPHVAFFVRRNPDHAQGHELACLTRISPDNLTSCGRRVACP